jgi:hypothetical protein
MHEVQNPETTLTQKKKWVNVVSLGQAINMEIGKKDCQPKGIWVDFSREES